MRTRGRCDGTGRALLAIARRAAWMLAALHPAVASAGGAVSAEFPAAWRFAQPLPIAERGLHKVSLPLDTLTRARPDLEDLRLLDPAGHEVPYLLERPARLLPSSRPPRALQVTLEAESTSLTIETGITQPLTGLSLQTPAADFLKAVRIEGSVDGTAWKLLAQGQPVFRERHGSSQLRVGFPPGEWPRLRVTLDDRGSPRIPVTGVLLHTQPRAEAATEPVEVRVVQRSEEPGLTRLTLRLPGPNVPVAALSLETPEPLFSRALTLTQQGLAESEIRESIIAQHTVYRVAVGGRPSTQSLDLPVDLAVRSRDLLLTIRNGDNPPLALTAVRARRRPVYLTFLATQAGAFFLLSGNREAAAPTYDLASLKTAVQGARVVTAAPGAVAENPGFRDHDPLLALGRVGPLLDLSGWQYRKSVQVGEAGVQRLELDLDVLSRAAPSLGDLRLIRENRQIPFVLERTSAVRSVTPALTPVSDPKRPALSRWQVRLPVRTAAISQLSCNTPALYFRREVRLSAEAPDERGAPRTWLLASGTWARPLGGKPVPLSLRLTGVPETDTLFLEIEDGDNAPLPLAEVQVWYSVSRLLFLSPASTDTLLYYGNAKATAPQYDIQVLAPTLMAAAKVQATAGAEEALQPRAADQRAAAPAGWVFWGVLALVVLALLAIVARLFPKASH
jgi:Protein of unknown function (DUF3999)